MFSILKWYLNLVWERGHTQGKLKQLLEHSILPVDNMGEVFLSCTPFE